MRPAILRSAAVTAMLLGSLVMAAGPATAASEIVVDTLDGTGAADGACSIVEAVEAADTDAAVDSCAAGSGEDHITFSVAGIIKPAAVIPADSVLTIDGAGAITLDGADSVQLMIISDTGWLHLNGLTFTGGAGFDGGAIGNNGGKLAIDRSVFTGNNAGNAGGAIANLGGAVAVTRTTMSGNSSHSFGGAMVTNGTLEVRASTFDHNSAGADGGAISIQNTARISNSTFANNTAGNLGGAIDVDGSLTLINATISGNQASRGGGVTVDSGSSTVDLANVLIVGNTASQGADLFGTAASTLASIVGVPSGHKLADILNPVGLHLNGGPTQTIALSTSTTNPAIDTADSATCAASPINSIDQRSIKRPAKCDIGAYERLPLPPTATDAFVATVPGDSAGSATVNALWLLLLAGISLVASARVLRRR